MNKKSLTHILIILIPLAVIFSMPLFINNYYWKSVFVLILINILLVASVRTVKLIGYISLGQVGFSAIGAYCSALLIMKAGLSFWSAFLIAGLLAGLIAMALGYLFLKTKGMYFAILTLLTAETIRNIIYYWPFTGGSMGLSNIPAPGPLFINEKMLIDFGSINGSYLLTLLIVVISLLILYILEHSRLNFRWRAICDDENLAKSIGMNIASYKVVNFAIACFFSGLAGALLAFSQKNLSADYTSIFGVFSSIYLIVYLFVGGETKFFGPIIGTIAMMLVSEFSRPLKEFQNMFIGAVAIAMVILIPGGLTGRLIGLLNIIRIKLPGIFLKIRGKKSRIVE